MGANVPVQRLQEPLRGQMDRVQPSPPVQEPGQRRAQRRHRHPKPRSWLTFAPTLHEYASKANRVRRWRAEQLL